MLLLPIVTLVSVFAIQAGAPVAPGEVRVATSSTHTLVIAPDGTVLCQGRNQFRVCGADLDTKFVAKLSPVPGVPKGRAVAVGDTWTSMVLGWTAGSTSGVRTTSASSGARTVGRPTFEQSRRRSPVSIA